MTELKDDKTVLLRDQKLREMALDNAIRISGAYKEFSTATTDGIIKDAEQFYNFLRGDRFYG